MASDRYDLIFKPTLIGHNLNNTGDISLGQQHIRITIRNANMSVVSINIEPEALANYLATDANPNTPYEPQYDGSPATKKYVDDSVKWIEVNVATAAGTAAKVGTTTAGNYTPTKGDFLLVNFVGGCSVDNPTLNIDGSGAKNIRTGSANANKTTFALGTTANSNIKALLYYDGTYYRCWSTTNSNTTYSAMSVSEGQTGTATSSRAMRADYLKQIIKYHAVSDTAYDSTWDGVTSIAPSKNAVYDKIESLSSSIPSSSATAPSNPTEGQLWYDTTNDVLKVYDGTNWNATGKEYNAGTGIEIGTIQDYSAMQGPAPDGFHVPLTTEWQAVKDIWTALGGGSSDGTNFGIALKLPFAGFRSYSNARVYSQDSYGYYWSSSRYDANYAYHLNFNSSDITPQSSGYSRACGFSVRCFKDTPTIPTSSWTKLYGTSIEAGGIFWSSTDGLISLSSDGTDWITIADKNLGATTVWNSGDTLSEANCGKYYQWGNNYGFPRTGSVTTSSTQVDASTYGPGNYYSSSTFITRSSSPYRWDTTDNGNLRGGETGVVTINNAITNTGVLSVNGQIGDVTINAGEASSIATTQPSNPVEGDVYYDTTNDVVKVYDGTNWIAVGVESNTKTFYLTTGTSSSALQKAQECYDWYKSGKNPIVSYNGINYILAKIESTRLTFQSTNDSFSVSNNSTTLLRTDSIYLSLSGDSVTAVYVSLSNVGKLLATDVDYSTPYTPLYNGSPATKKYVDDNAGIQNDTTGTTSTISQEWVGTKAEFEALSSYGDKIYNIIE